MKIVIPGGTGHVGALLERACVANAHEVIVLGRSAPNNDAMQWDGKTLGPWANVVDGADVVINLAGRSVNCRYTKRNREDMMNSRVDSTRAVGQAIARAVAPPRVWLQMSTATIYSHRLDAANDEATGQIGGGEGASSDWSFSTEIAKAWEAAQHDSDTPRTRKIALRSAMVMGSERDGIFDVLYGLVRRGLGGSIGGGAQYVSWIHEHDFARSIELLIARDDFEGPVNLAAPNPLPQREFMAALRVAANRRVGLPATKWMAKLGAFVMRTESELILKSRRVVPGRLLAAGFSFAFPTWPEAALELVERRSRS